MLVFMKFDEYCKKNNINLLLDDKRFLKRHLKMISKASRKDVVRRYVDIWVKTRGSDNEKRREANIWLRSIF